MLRFLSLLWATLQLASPAMSAVADGRLARDGAGDRTAHVESSTTSSCPVVHPPDCGVCRYLSGCGILPGTSAPPMTVATEMRRTPSRGTAGLPPSLALPDGRAPPTR